jgi:hypothetical protein
MSQSIPSKPRKPAVSIKVSPGYEYTGAVLRQMAILDILARLDQASRIARRIDAQQNLNGDHSRSTVLRLAD